jgi:hypothetical protein
VQLFTERRFWDDLAFPTIRTTLELFFADRVKIREGGSYGFHTQDITRNMRSDIDRPRDSLARHPHPFPDVSDRLTTDAPGCWRPAPTCRRSAC